MLLRSSRQAQTSPRSRSVPFDGEKKPGFPSPKERVSFQFRGEGKVPWRALRTLGALSPTGKEKVILSTVNGQLSTEKQIIALLPGSRKQEIQKKLPIMLEVSKKFPLYNFIVAQAPSLDDDFYNQMFKNYSNVSAVKNQTYALLIQSAAALVTSGTATLETALFAVPEVVCYKGNPISYQIAKRLVKIRFISLVNLILNKEAVKELFTVVAPKIAARPGGYTRIIKLGIRPGDNAEKAMIELVDFNEVYGNSKATAAEPAKKTRRSKSTSTKKSPAKAKAEAQADEAETATDTPETAAE